MLKTKPMKFIYLFIALFSLLLVGCEFETGSSDVSSISSEQSSSESSSSVLEELEIDFSGLEESKHYVNDIVDVLDGVTAMGNDSNDYTSQIVATSENCTITNNKITSDVPKTCVVEYVVKVDDEDFKGTKNFVFEEKVLTKLTISGADKVKLYVGEVFNVLTGVSASGDDDKDYTDHITYEVLEGASVDSTTHLLDTSLEGETTIKYLVKVGEVTSSVTRVVEVVEKKIVNNDLTDPSTIVPEGEKEILANKAVDYFYLWRVLDAGWGCGPVVEVPYEIHDGQLDINVSNLNGNTNNWSVQLFYLTDAIEEEGTYALEFDIITEKARKITIDRRTNWEPVTLGVQTATMLDMNADEQIIVSLEEGLNHVKVRFSVDAGEHIMLKVLLGLHESEDASQQLLTFKNFVGTKVEDEPLTSLTINGPVNKTLPVSDNGFDLLSGVTVLGNDMKDYTSALVVSSENGTIVDGVLDISAEGDYKVVYSATVGEVTESIEITISVIVITNFIKDGTMDGTLGEHWKFNNPLKEDETPWMEKFEPTIEEGELRVNIIVGPDASWGDNNSGSIYQDITGLEAGATYKLSFRAKSTLNRSLIMRFRNNGQYVMAGEERVNLTQEFNLFEYEFIARNLNGEYSTLAFYMGEAWGRPDGEHVVTMDDFVLVKVKDPNYANPDNIFGDGLADGKDFIKVDHTYVGRVHDWAYFLANEALSPSRTIADNMLTVITEGFTNEADWSYILFYLTMPIEEAGTYVVSYKVNSTTNRRIVFDNSNAGAASPVTGRTDVDILEGEHTYEIEYNVSSAQPIMLKILLGPKTDAKAENENYNGTLIFSDIVITKK